MTQNSAFKVIMSRVSFSRDSQGMPTFFCRLLRQLVVNVSLVLSIRHLLQLTLLVQPCWFSSFRLPLRTKMCISGYWSWKLYPMQSSKREGCCPEAMHAQDWSSTTESTAHEHESLVSNVQKFRKGLAVRGGCREEILPMPEIEASFLYPFSYAFLGEGGCLTGELFLGCFAGFVCCQTPPANPFSKPPQSSFSSSSRA